MSTESNPENTAMPTTEQTLQQAIARHQAGQLQEAGELYLAVLQAQPGHAEANHKMGILAVQMGQHAAALSYLMAALEANPAEGRYWLSYINALFQAGQLEGAREVLALARQQGLAGDEVDALALRLKEDTPVADQPVVGKQQPASAPALPENQQGSAPSAQEINALLALFNGGRLDEAAAMAQDMTVRFPEHGVAWKMLGVLFNQMGRSADALAPMQKAAVLLPDDAEAHNNLGITLQDLDRPDEAETSYRRALQIKPDYAQAHSNLGSALQSMGRLDEAEASYRRALQIKPDYVKAYCNLGATLQELERLDEAETTLKQAIQINPHYAEAHYNLGVTLQALGRLDEAEASYQRVLQINPGFAEAHYNLGNALNKLGRPSEAEASYRKALQINPDYVDAHTNLLFCLQFIPDKSLAEVFAEHLRFAEQFEAPLKPFWKKHPNTREPERRLKIGYVSGDFCRHAVAYFIEPVLAHHDKSRFEVYCYYNNTRQDDFTDRIIACADHWIPCKFLSDEQLAGRIRADGIDILIDLSGHTSGNRMLVFARKPAPLQVTYLGYPGTSGLSAMDYRITDRYADPEENEIYYSEKLLRLPNSLCCYRPADDMPEIGPLPALRNGYITFGSLNNFNKINDQCLELWATLLKTVPTARLLMATVPEGIAREQLIVKFTALGIPAERLELYGKLPTHEFIRVFQKVDIALDPFPVTGGTTTCESLWMGLPVIILVGQRYISRVGYSFLSAAGMHDFAAYTPEDYIKVATCFANNIPMLAQLHDGMRARIAASPLCGEAGFTRNLENAYRDIWARWCDSVA